MRGSSFGFLAAGIWVASAIAAVLISSLVVLAHSRVKDLNVNDPQHIHVGFTSRLGGLAVLMGFAVAVAITLWLESMPLLPALLLLMAAMPLEIVGLWEDVTHRALPRHRLLAAVFSAALASAFAHGVVTRLDLPFVDGWLAYWPFALPLTWFMVVGACNAFNIIDGTNGLAGGSAVLMFSGLAIVASNVGDALVLAETSAMTGALMGFLLWNYPKGKLFLGDAGAYFIGFMYAQLSIQLVSRNSGVSAWFVVALAAYPIVETLYSIYRRKIVGHVAAMQPDIQHLHSLLYLFFLRSSNRPPLEERRLGLVVGPYSGMERRQPQRRANARVAPHLWLHGALCLAIALYYFDNTPVLIGFVLGYGIVYRVCYRNAAERSDEHEAARLTSPSTGD
jgi:UDP-N-acetylmuramyl pentapeptide phosphotransferase/UDP-N-acetylglucosamine-1-phosphate transferase